MPAESRAYNGRRQSHAPLQVEQLPEKLALGIFLCKDVNEQRLRALVSRLLDEPRVAQIVIRPHPKNLWLGLDEWVASQKSRVNCSRNSLDLDVKSVDIVLGGNSSVLIDAVTAGRPSGFVSGLDYGSCDLHEFVRRGLIYPINDDLRLDLNAIIQFYRQPDWPKTFPYFANVDEDELSVLRRAISIMREMIAART